jgi:serine/threonine-protein kinase
MIGSTVGDYRITEKLGAGGFGVVYKAVHRMLDQEVAIKTLDPILTRDPRFRQRFFDEARTQARLKHPNIVVLHNFFEHDSQYFIVMEYVEGMSLPGGHCARTLAELIKPGPIPESRILALARQILDGVACAHEHGVLHRDIKPLNVLLTERGLVKIADFGIAKIVGGETSVSVSGTRVGTAPYMSPEQVLNEPLTRASDIYSLGITLYEMATGEIPFKSTSTESIEKQHLYSPPPSLRKRNPWVSENLEAVVLKALAKKPEDRFQSCAELAAALEGRSVAPISQPMPQLDVTRPEPPAPGLTPGVSRSARPRAGLFIGLAAAAIALAVGVGLLLRPKPEAVPVRPVHLEMPDLAGLAFSDARSTILGRGLTLAKTDSTLTDDVDKGTVVSFSPAAGADVKRGDSVRVTYSWGRKTCPDCGTARNGTARFCTKCGYKF